MTNAITRSIRLLPTKNPDRFSVRLKSLRRNRRIGLFDRSGEGTFKTERKPEHLHQNTNSIALNAEFVRDYDFRWIIVEYGGDLLVTTKPYLIHHGTTRAYPAMQFEEQIFLPLQLWGRERAIAFEKTYCIQGELFEESIS
jgi:hypothetical protein